MDQQHPHPWKLEVQTLTPDLLNQNCILTRSLGDLFTLDSLRGTALEDKKRNPTKKKGVVNCVQHANIYVREDED